MAGLIKFEEAEPVDWGDGIESMRLTPSSLEDQGFTMGVTSFPPGTSIVSSATTPLSKSP